MINNVTIWGAQALDDRDTILELTDSKERNASIEQIKKDDHRWGFDLAKRYHHLNRYDNDDYIFVANLLQHLRKLHRMICTDPRSNTWIPGNAEIPYIHLHFTEEPVFKVDSSGSLIYDDKFMPIPDDSKLNMGVKPPYFNGTYRLDFNYYWLRQYVKFLQKIFDSNEECVVSLPNDFPCGQLEYGNKSKIGEMVNTLFAQGRTNEAESLRLYMNSLIGDDNVPLPVLSFQSCESGNRCIGWSIFDPNKNSFTLQMKKSIYSTSGFASLYYDRTSLIADIFISSLEMILGHEMAHIARGHWNLRLKDPQYSMERNVMMNCEIQADHTSLRWLLLELLYDTVTDDPHFHILAYTKEHLIYLWSVRIFSSYLVMSWGYRDDDRKWGINTLESFIQNRTATHPPYQFRVFSLLNHAKSQLDHMAKQSQIEGYVIRTADNQPLDKAFFKEVWSTTMNLVHSFEASFRTSWGNDERDTMEKLQDSIVSSKDSIPLNITDVPFMMAYMSEAQKELDDYEKQWPEILEKLKKCGMYFSL